MMLTILVGAAAAVSGAPIYLSCAFNPDEPSTRIDLALNEANQSAVISSPTKEGANTVPAHFSAGTVTVRQAIATWTIDRVSLRIKRQIEIGNEITTSDGKCRLVSAPVGRAF
jgi:hypothetical protein